MKLPRFALAAGLLLASRTHAATVTELPLLPTPAGFTAAPWVAHVNSNGDVAGLLTFTRKPCLHCAVQTIHRSFLVTGGNVTPIGPDGFMIVSANDAGTIVGNLYDLASGSNYAYRYQDGSLTPLDTVPRNVVDLTEGGLVSFGGYVNDHGVVAGLASDGEHATHVYKWVDGFSLTDMVCSVPSPEYECVTGGTTGYDAVHDLNSGATPGEAMVVGEDRDNPWYSSYGMQHAFVGWRGQTSNLSSGFTAAALAVNDFGEIAGYDDGQAVVWMRTGDGTWTEQTIASLVNDPAWTFSRATALNNPGVVAGVGLHNGVPAAFVMTPAATAVGGSPSPHALAFSVQPKPSRGPVRFTASGLAPGTGSARITIADVAGRRIAELTAASRGGQFSIPWDGLDARGQRPGPGVYFARLEAGARVAHATVLIVK